MPTATVTTVYPKGPTKSGKNGPGAVVFSDGVKLSTFSDADLSTAKGLIGQLAEYGVETKGQYTNLASIKAAGVVPSAQPSAMTGPALSASGIDVPAVVTALNGVAAAMREMAAEYRKVAAGILTGPPVASPGASAPATPAATATDSAAVIAEMQDRLAAVVGDDAADAMFSAIKKRHGKSPEKLQAAAAELLKLHDIGAEAA